MADDEGKGLLALMVGKPKKSEAGASSSSSSSSAKADAAKEFFAAGKAGEWKEAALIFERMHELCAGDYEDEDEDEDEEIEEE